MTSIVSLSLDGTAVTTTLAIAEGTDNQHKAVIQLVRTYLADLQEFGRVAFEMAPFETAGGTQQREIAILTEQQATLLFSYMRNSDVVRAFKKRLVKAFYELAARDRVQQRLLPGSPEATMSSWLAAAALLGVPAHLAQSEAVKAVARTTGVDYTPLLAHAPAQNDVPDTEVMLEPTDLAKLLGVRSGKDMNRLLGHLGLQERKGLTWVPTVAGARMSAVHQWVSGGKSGYNLKWRVGAVQRAIAEAQVSHAA